MENHNTETAHNCRQFLYLNFKEQNDKKHAFCYNGKPYENSLQISSQFPYLNFMCHNVKKHVLQEKIGIRKLPTIVGSFRIWILSGKTPKNTRLAIENWNTETVYNCRQFPYFNFKWKNANKHAFCYGGHEYGNCLQL